MNRLTDSAANVLLRAYLMHWALVGVESALADMRGERAAQSAPGPFIYLVGAPGFLKIGFTTSFASRFASLRTSAPFKLSVLGVLKGDRSLERQLHARFAEHCLQGEWYRDVLEIRDFFATDDRRLDPKTFVG